MPCTRYRKETLHCVMVIGYNFYWPPIDVISYNEPLLSHCLMKRLKCLANVVSRVWLRHLKMALDFCVVSIEMSDYFFISLKFLIRWACFEKKFSWQRNYYDFSFRLGKYVLVMRLSLPLFRIRVIVLQTINKVPLELNICHLERYNSRR